MKTGQKKQLILIPFAVLGLTLLTLLTVILLPLTRGNVTAAPQAQRGLNAPNAIPSPIFFDTLSGFDLYHNGFFWWNTLGAIGCPGGEFSNQASIKVRGLLGAATKILEDKRCPILQDANSNPVRDSQYLYYFENKQLVHKALSASASTPPTPLTNAPPLTTLGSAESLAIDTVGRLYWSTYSNGALSIWRMKADNSEAPTQFTKINTACCIQRMMTYRFRSSLTGPTVDGIALLANGNLWRYNDNVISPLLLGSNIREFWVHVDSGGALGTQTVTFYAATSAGLLQISASGNSTMIYQSPTSASTDGVTTDNQNIYLVDGVYNCSGGGFCTPDPTDRSIHRRALNAPNTTPWDTLVLQGGGVNLRSDGQFLYFLTDYSTGTNSGKALKRVPTDTPPVQVDIEATDLEVTQAIQDLNESFALVAGHPTFVRGYARVAVSTDPTSYHFTASLTGKLNGQPLPGSPLAALNPISVNTTLSAEKRLLRDTFFLTFLFSLPESWLKDELKLAPDQLTLEMTVNPTGDPPENVGADPYANNKVSVTAQIAPAKQPCLVVSRLRGGGAPLVAPEMPGLAEQIAWARSLLPISDFRVITLNGSVLTNDGGDYDVREKDGAKQALNDLNDLTAYLTLCNDQHWVGLLHGDTPAYFNGISYTGDDVLLLRFNDRAGQSLAHELGHNYGRNHINCGHFGDGTDIFDFTLYDPCNLYFTNFSTELLYYGFDFFHLNYLTSVKNPADYADVMSYKLDARWPSFDFWSILLKTIPNSALTPNEQATATALAPSTTGEMLYVSGDLAPAENNGVFNTVYHLADGVAPGLQVAQSMQAARALRLAPQGSNAGLAIRQLAPNNVLLSETPVVTKTFNLHTTGALRYGFSQYLPFAPQTTKIQLVQGDTVLAERSASASPPNVTLNTPVLDNTAGTVTLRWAATDNDGGALHAMLLYSSDDGAHWLPLAQNLNGLEATFSTQTLAGGTKARMRLIVDDGFNTSVANSSPFAVDKHAPTPMIDGIVGGRKGAVQTAQGLVERQRLSYKALTWLRGLVLDADEGSQVGGHLNWTLSGPSNQVYNGTRGALSGPSSQVYTGTQMLLAGLAPGDYRVTLSATDSDGMSGAATKYFEVLPIPVPDGKTPGLDGSCSDAAYADAVVVPLNDQGTQANLVHSGGALYVCFSGLTLGTGSTVNLAGLRVNANNSQEPIAQGDDRGFFIDQNGIPFQAVGNGSDMPVTLSPAPGFAALTVGNKTGWSAEVSIADPLIGGWGHAASILFQANGADPAANPHNWPPNGIYNQPNTWAAALFGVAPTLANRPPVADAGDDQTWALRQPASLALDSSASYDVDLDVITSTWQQVGGPTVSLTDPTTYTIRFNANPVSEPTLLRFQLTVNDGQASSKPDEVEVTLLPAKPIMGVGQLRPVYLPFVAK